MEESLYFICDRRNVSNNTLWFLRKDRCGYTSNLNHAGRFTLLEVYENNKNREYDLPYPVKFILDRAKLTCDLF